MPDIPYDLVGRQIQRKMKCHGQLHCTEVRPQMAARYTDLLNQKLSDFCCQTVQIFFLYFFDIIRFLYTVKQHNPCLLSAVYQTSDQFLQERILPQQSMQSVKCFL